MFILFTDRRFDDEGTLSEQIGQIEQLRMSTPGHSRDMMTTKPVMRLS